MQAAIKPGLIIKAPSEKIPSGELNLLITPCTHRENFWQGGEMGHGAQAEWVIGQAVEQVRYGLTGRVFSVGDVISVSEFTATTRRYAVRIEGIRMGRYNDLSDAELRAMGYTDPAAWRMQELPKLNPQGEPQRCWLYQISFVEVLDS